MESDGGGNRDGICK